MRTTTIKKKNYSPSTKAVNDVRSAIFYGKLDRETAWPCDKCPERFSSLAKMRTHKKEVHCY